MTNAAVLAAIATVSGMMPTHNVYSPPPETRKQ
jgi:hypothetical protein